MSLSALGFSSEYLVNQLIGIPGFLLFFCFRGFCEAWTARKLGDNTAYMNGYMTMSPRKHINIIGFLCLILLGFGFSNSVPVNTRNFKKIKRDNAIQILSSPLSGVVLMTASLFLYYVLFLIGYKLNLIPMALGNSYDTLAAADLLGGKTAVFYNVILAIVGSTATTSIFLAVFYMLPLPGFDGYKLIANFLPYRYYRSLYNIEKYSMYIFIIFIILLRTFPALYAIIAVPASAALNLVSGLFFSIVKLFL